MFHGGQATNKDVGLINKNGGLYICMYRDESKPCSPVVHIKIVGKQMFIPLNIIILGIDPSIYIYIYVTSYIYKQKDRGGIGVYTFT